MPDKMVEIRWHARGGQGAKTAATLVAAVALEEGKFSQGFPDYGPEREGAPIRGYTRISDTPVQVHSAIYTPDIVVVLDASLLDSVEVSEGLKSDGIILINSASEPAVLRKKLGLQGGKVYTVDATQIAIEEIGRPIMNTAILGAFSKLSGQISLDAIERSIRHRFRGELGDRNIRAAQRAYEAIRE